LNGQAQLHYEIEGAGHNIVLLHPVGLDRTFMGPLLTDATQGHRVINIDLRGHGRSPDVSEDMPLGQYVEDIHAVIETACTGAAIVLGLSFGGMLAQQLALTYPQDVAGLILCGCGGGFAAEIRPLLRERGVTAQRGGMKAVIEPTIERWFTPSFRADTWVNEVRARLSANDPVNWSSAWHAIATFDAFARLAQVTVPTLVVAGEHDVATPLPATRALADAIGGAQHAVVAGAPHMMQLECRDAFNHVVAAFLSQWRARA
jgi:3-oxoadipate enol-lactonase